MISIGVVGAGVMGARHARVVAEHPRTRLVYVADPDYARGRAVADKYGCAWTPDLEGLFVDAVIVASPTGTHEQEAYSAFDHGRPVLVEKPVVADLAATERVLEIAAKLDVPLMCGLVDRFNPAWLTLRSLLREPPQHVTMTRQVPHYARISEGVAWDLAIHLADHAIALHGGLPERVWAQSATHHPDSVAEDTVDALLSWLPIWNDSNSCRKVDSDSRSGNVVLSVGKTSHRKDWTVTVQTGHETIVADLVRWTVTVYRTALAGEGALTTVEEIPIRNVVEPLVAQLDHFLALIDGGGRANERDSILAAHQLTAQIAGS